MFDHFNPPPRPPADRLATLVDVTLRDGGFEINFEWPARSFADVTGAVAPLGIDIVELGYLGGVPLEHGVPAPGPGAYLTPNHVAAARRDGLHLAAMVHPTALHGQPDLKPYVTAGLNMLRLVYHPAWFDDIAALAAAARDCGLVVTVNIALASRYRPAELVDHARRIHTAMHPDVIYLADTCGALTPDQVANLIAAVRDVTQAQIGFHPHDFLTLGYANALAAAQAGATYLDCSILGLGRGGGNLATDLMLLRHRLPGYRDTTALHKYVTVRNRLCDVTSRPNTSLLPIACGALNLTPVEEKAVIDFINDSELDDDVAAMWLACTGDRNMSWRVEELCAAWQIESGR